jgi:outer membrane protein TolC
MNARCRIAFTLSLACASSSFAMGSRAPDPTTEVGTPNPCLPEDYTPPTPLAENATIELSPEKLGEYLFYRNNDIFLAANSVQRAKNEVTLARTKLLPSIDMGTVLLAAGNPTFLITQIQSLLPFLIPQNWFQLAKSKEMLDADRLSYRIIAMNTEAQALAMYHMLLNDLGVMDNLATTAASWREIEQLLSERYSVGLITGESLALAQSQRALAELRYEKIRSLLADHLANLKKGLALGPDQNLVLSRLGTPAAPYETATPVDALGAAAQASLELKQMHHLGEAAKRDRWSRYFGFISSASLSTAYRAPGTTDGLREQDLAFDKLAGTLNLHFGFDYFPLIKLSQRNIDDITLRKREIGLEINRVLEGSRLKLPAIQHRVDLAREAEAALRRNFDIVYNRFKIGAGVTLLDLIQARIGIEQSITERLLAEMEQSLTRVSLHRIYLTDVFAKVPSCHYVNPAEREAKGHWWSRRSHQAPAAQPTTPVAAPAPAAPAA